MQPDKKPRNIFLYILIGCVSLIVLAALFFLFHAMSLGRELATTPHSYASQSTSTPDSTRGSTDSTAPSNSESIDTAFSNLSDKPTCKDSKEDATTISSWINAHKDTNEDPNLETLKSAASTLVSSCGTEYALALRTELLKSDLPTDFAEELASLNWLKKVRPAPEGAIDLTEFTTQLNNIRCVFEGGKISCSIYKYDFPSPTSCQGETATYTLGLAEETTVGCSKKVNTSKQVDYGTTITHDGLACTVSKSEGVECWSEYSGHGFTLKRSEADIF